MVMASSLKLLKKYLTKQNKSKIERERERERERKEGKGKQSYRRISRKRGNVVNGMLKEAKSLWD